MADPLSITASIIAVLGAAESVGKAFAKIRNIRNAPSEVLALINEVSDLRIILGDVERYFIRGINGGQYSGQLQTMSCLVDRAKEYLLELDQLIQYRLLKPNSSAAQYKISRHEWVTAKHIMERFRQGLRDVRLNLVTQMIVINSSHQARIALTIDEIHIVSDQIRSSQLNASDRAIEQLNEHSRILSSLVSGQSELQDLLRLSRSTSPGLNTSEEQASMPIIGVRAFTTQHRRSPCSQSCKCKCHNVHSFQSPSALHNLVGTLFIGYSGCPMRSLQRCTESSCLSQSTFRAYVHYLFPLWFLTKSLTVTFMMMFPAQLQIALTVRRIVPSGAEIFLCERVQDIDGMKKLFSKGLASPNDSEIGGGSLLYSAVANRELELCDFLLSAGADPHLAMFKGGLTPFRSAWTFIFSSHNEPFKARLRALFPAADDDYGEWQFSIIHRSVLGLISTDMESLLARYPTDIDLTDSTGKTALSWAAKKGDDAALSLLLKAGADVGNTDDTGISPLLSAARLGSIACTKLLLEANADVHHKDSFSCDALLCAADCVFGPDYTDSEHVLKLLLRAGGDPNSKNIYGAGPLAWTARRNNSSLAAVLLDCGADINSRDDDGDTPLCEALLTCADDMIQLLLQRGADYTIQLSRGDSILHLASRSGSMRTLNILLAANLRGFDPHSQNRAGKTATQMAQERLLKPDGFVEKTFELVMKIDARNVQSAQIRRQNNHPPNCSADEGIRTAKIKTGIFSILRKRLRTSTHQYADQATLSTSLVWEMTHKWLRQLGHVLDVLYPKLRRFPFWTLFLGWILGLTTLWLINSHNVSSPTTSENLPLTHILDRGNRIGRQKL